MPAPVGTSPLPNVLTRFHRLVGWLFFLPLGFMSATGILLGVGEQIERVLEPRLFSIASSSQPVLDEGQIAARLTGYGDTVTLEPHASPFDTYQASYVSTSGESRQLWIDPLSGTILADRPRASRLTHRLTQLHSLGYPLFSGTVSIATCAVCISGLLLFNLRHKGRYFWHSYTMLAVTPFALWQASSGFLISTGIDTPILIHAHDPPYFALRLLLVIAMLTLIAGLAFMLIARFHPGAKR